MPQTRKVDHAERGFGVLSVPGGGVEYHPSHGEWIRVLRESGFEVEAVHELQYALSTAATPEYYDIATAEWSRKWPVEDLWTARLAR